MKSTFVRSELKRTISAFLFVLALSGLCGVVFAQTSATTQQQSGAATDQSNASVESYIESARADLRADKSKVIAEAIPMNSKEASAFWPIYRKYETDLQAINDKRLKLIEEYNNEYPNFKPDTVGKMGENWFDLEKKKLDLQRQTYDQISKAVSPTIAAQFAQVEHRIDLLMDLNVASQLPLIPNKNQKPVAEQ